MAEYGHKTTGVSVMRKGSNWPRPGMPRDHGGEQGNDIQRGPGQLNASIGPNRRMTGGGGMAVGPLRNQAGVGIHPKAARTALVNGMKGC